MTVKEDRAKAARREAREADARRLIKQRVNILEGQLVTTAARFENHARYLSEQEREIVEGFLRKKFEGVLTALRPAGRDRDPHFEFGNNEEV